MLSLVTILLLLLSPSISHAQVCSLNNAKCVNDGNKIDLWDNCGSTNLLGQNITIGNSTTNSVKIKDHEYVPLVYTQLKSTTFAYTSSSFPFVTDAKFWVSEATEGDDAPFVTGATESEIVIAVDGLYHVIWEGNTNGITSGDMFAGFVNINNADPSETGNKNRFGGYVTQAGPILHTTNSWIQMEGTFYKRLKAGDSLKLIFGTNNNNVKSFCRGTQNFECRFFIKLISY